MTPAPDSPTRLGRWALPAILILATLLRVWGIGFGLPHLEARPDEIEVVSRSIRLLSGDLNPHFFHYPSLYLYLLGLVFAVGSLVSMAMGSSFDEFLARAAVDPSSFVLSARILTSFLGALTVYGVYRLGHRIHGSPAGLLAASFLAVAHLHVRESHFATTDVALTLFLVWAVLHLVVVAETGELRAYVWAGVLSGCALSTKYVGLLLPATLVVAHLISCRPWQGVGPWSERLGKVATRPGPWLFALSMLVAFIVTSPYSVLDWPLFSSHFRFQMSHLSEGHGVDLGIGGWYHLRHTLPKGLGWPVFLAGLIGAGWSLRRHPRRATVLLTFPILFFLTTMGSRTLFLRYMLPILPFLCLTAGWWIAHVTRDRKPGWPWVLPILALLSAIPLADVVATNLRLARTDTRLEAAAWLEAEMAGGIATVFQTGSHWGWLQLSLTADSMRVLRATASRARDVPGLQRLRRFSLAQADARLAEAENRGGGFETMVYHPDEGFAGPGSPDWIILLESPLVQYSTVPQGLEVLLEEDYSPVRTFRATRAGETGWYDQHDSFYLPFKRIRVVTRPGPDVTVFRRVAPNRDLSPGPREDGPSEETP